MSLTSYRAAPPRVCLVCPGYCWLACPVDLFFLPLCGGLLHPAFVSSVRAIVGSPARWICCSPAARGAAPPRVCLVCPGYCWLACPADLFFSCCAGGGCSGPRGSDDRDQERGGVSDARCLSSVLCSVDRDAIGGLLGCFCVRKTWRRPTLPRLRTQYHWR